MSKIDPKSSQYVAFRALATGRTLVERGEYQHARKHLQIAQRMGERSVRQTAEGLLAELPQNRMARQPWKIFSVAVAAIIVGGILTAFILARVYLPDTEETRKIAHSVHMHVVKRTIVDETGERKPTIELVGNRFDYSLNVRLENVSSHFINAVIASEDHRFRERGSKRFSYIVGKFFLAGAKCLVSRERCVGNSTVTQQLARNLLGSEHRNILRKFLELFWALKMELEFSKDQILEFYVNRIFLGNHNYGVEMASRDYFGKPASDLTLNEAVRLAASIKSPSWNPRASPAYQSAAVKRANVILSVMKREGYAPSHHSLPSKFDGRRGMRRLSRPFLGHMWQWVRKDLGAHLDSLPDGKYKVFTTLNAEVQIYAENELEREIGRWQRKGVQVSQGAVVVLRPGGEVIAMVGGFGDSERSRGINRAKRTKGLIPRPPASTFKPFIYLSGIEKKGLRPETIISAEPIRLVDEWGMNYQPENYDGKYYGSVSLSEGLAYSINTAAVRLLNEVGYENLFDTLERLGVNTQYLERNWGLALGASGIPLIEMVGAYSIIANGGYGTAPVALTAFVNKWGRIKYIHRRDYMQESVFEENDIRDLDGMLRQVVNCGTGIEAATSGLLGGLPIAGKTGTGDGYVDAWFIGYINDLVIGIWFGNDKPSEMTGLSGGAGPARTFKSILEKLVEYTDVVHQHDIKGLRSRGANKCDGLVTR